MVDSFPRQKARTRNFTLGAPRSFSIAADASRVVFLRSPAGDDPQTGLWVLDVAEGRERLVADPRELLGGGADGGLSAQERARRERVRETAEGVVSYAIDRDARVAALALVGRLFVVDLLTGDARELEVPTPVFDPRPDPSGRHVAFVHARGLHAIRLVGGDTIHLAGEPAEAVSWGTAEFVAAEEMGRGRGFWWSPDGDRLLAARVDETPVQQLWIADAANPEEPPRAVRYPAPGTANALVELHLLGLDGRAPVKVDWDSRRLPYLADADWDDHGPRVVVQSRDQRELEVLAVDPASGETELLDARRDATWIDLLPGSPRRLADGRLVCAAGRGDAVALHVDGVPVTPADLQVRAILSADETAVVFTASREPTETHVWRWQATDGLTALTTEAGAHTAVSRGGVQLIGSTGLDHDGTRWQLGDHVFVSHAERPTFEPTPRLLSLGEAGIRAGLLLPRDHEPGSPLPVLMDPYGGPHFQRVQAVRQLWHEPQWLADQGFAVVVADGRGTPGRGLAWARAVDRDLASAALADQVSALQELAAIEPDLDLTRVAIRGWSFGGYLAALAVLRRPDVFRAAVAGAPVTDWRLYDTHYTERYLGVAPDGEDRAAYERSSLQSDAPSLRRPLLLIHGLVDDNVVAAHTLRLSQRLTESGRPHSVLPLTGVTHMTPQEAVAENLLTIQVDFLRKALG